MASERELESKLWRVIKSDRTMMLGLDGAEHGHTRPMTAQLDTENGPIWFFAARDNVLVGKLAESRRAFATFASKGHDLFATIQGTLALDDNKEMIDRLWNRFVAAWFPGGKSDPNLALLRFDPEHAEVWIDASSVIAGIKLLLGADPKKEYRDKVGELDLRR